ncbi:MAG TPA: peptide deformylase [Candidatus Fimiplasma intestinipullorum]|uniref:Peptide deformylase n=1 Tax=Candidatus Fimiplasma intestinipullorum TaxID=2840825 RepID=A0A9D1HLI8_9FIRM|nr:peptide deformylase [Candidatus Fimiplasma intestinipullorum]
MLLMKDIIDDKNPLIRETSQPVSLPLDDQDRQTLMDMFEYLKLSQDDEQSEAYGLRPGVGLAAVQIGVLKRMCAILIYDYDQDGEIVGQTAYALVNPKIISHSERMAYLKDGEGCLSVNDDHQGYVPRYAKVTIKGYDALTDQEVKIVARGYEAIVFQHELDHFDGIIFYDKIDADDPFKPIPNAMAI